MKNKGLFKLLALAISLCIILSSVAVISVFAADVSLSLKGAGTWAKPYEISNADDLVNFAEYVNAGNGCSGLVFYVKEDIDLDNQAFTPIGNTGAYFAGYFDGKNHTISGLNVTVNHKKGAGLFGAIKAPGWIKNIHVEGSVVSTYNDAGPCNIGGLVGNVSANVTLFNCSFNGLVRSLNSNADRVSAGGLVGVFQSTTKDAPAVMDHCYFSGTLDAKGKAGGLFAAVNSGTDVVNVYNSYSDAVVTGSDAGTSTLDYATGTAGGLIGATNAGKVSLNNCFFAGTAPGMRSSKYGGPITGRLDAGAPTCSNVFYDSTKTPDNTGTDSTAGVTGVDTDTLTYTTWGLFPTTFISGDKNVAHPQLRLAEMGKGSNDEPYVVDSASDLKLLSAISRTNFTYNFRDDFILLGKDIDLDNKAFDPIGSTNTPFRGNFDGKGYTISNLNVKLGSSIGVGLFGACADNTVKNLNVEGTVECTLKGGAVAGIVGSVSGTSGVLKNCSFNGTVTSIFPDDGNRWNYNAASGLVGVAAGHYTIDKCYVLGTINGFGRGGGLLGVVNGQYNIKISNSYCAAEIVGEGSGYEGAANASAQTSGGLLGFLASGSLSLTNCFFYGSAPAKRSATSAGPVIYSHSSGTLTLKNVYFNSDVNAPVEGFEFVDTRDGVGYTATEFADGTVTALLGGQFEQGEFYPVFSKPHLANGDGSEDNPYLISSVEDFEEINRLVLGGNNLEGLNFRLTTNLVLNENAEDYESWKTTAPANEWEPIGKQGKPFAGNLDGAGHTISGMYIDDATEPAAAGQERAHGFFGATYRGTIKNLHIKDSYVAAYRVVGGVTGMAQESTFENCSFEGYVFGYNTNTSGGSAGGFVGAANISNTFVKCYTAGTIDSVARSAGIIGAATASGTNEIFDCYSTMTVTGLGVKDSFGSGTGGLVGIVQNGTIVIENSFFAGTYPAGTNRGPIVGQVAGTVEDNNVYYLGAADGLYGEPSSAEEFADDTVRGLLQGERTETIWIQGELTPVFAMLGDLNFDAIIDVADAIIVLRDIEKVEACNDISIADVSGDGVITVEDYEIIKEAALFGIAIEEAVEAVSEWSDFA